MIIEIIANGTNVTIPNADNKLVAELKAAVKAWERRTYGEPLVIDKTMYNTVKTAMLMQNMLIFRKTRACKNTQLNYVRHIEG